LLTPNQVVRYLQLQRQIVRLEKLDAQFVKSDLQLKRMVVAVALIDAFEFFPNLHVVIHFEQFRLHPNALGNSHGHKGRTGRHESVQDGRFEQSKMHGRERFFASLIVIRVVLGEQKEKELNDAENGH
jgi:hypothetical protein